MASLVLSARPTSGAPRVGALRALYLSATGQVNDIAETKENLYVAPDELEHLRVLIANIDDEQLGVLVPLLFGLGHEVIAREIGVKDFGATTAREHPDVALIGLTSDREQALEAISTIVRAAACPVIALLSDHDLEYVTEVAARGVFASIAVSSDPQALQSALSITLRRFAEYQNLQGAFGRRATIEQAKGILMASRAVDESSAFDMLREHSRRTDRKLIEIAEAVVYSHLLLLPSGTPGEKPGSPD